MNTPHRSVTLMIHLPRVFAITTLLTVVVADRCQAQTPFRLTDGDRVVIDGLQRITPGQPVTTTDVTAFWRVAENG